MIPLQQVNSSPLAPPLGKCMGNLRVLLSIPIPVPVPTHTRNPRVTSHGSWRVWVDPLSPLLLSPTAPASRETRNGGFPQGQELRGGHGPGSGSDAPRAW